MDLKFTEEGQRTYDFPPEDCLDVLLGEAVHKEASRRHAAVVPF